MMLIKQVSVFAENQPGTLCEILTSLKESNVNLKALSVAETEDFGIVRFIAEDTQKAQAILKEAGFTVKLSTVLTVSISNHPGSLLSKIKQLAEAGINIEYFYAFAQGCDEEAQAVLKVDQPEKAEELLD